MPSSPQSNAHNPFSITKDMMNVYTKRRRSSTSYDRTLQEISKKMSYNYRESIGNYPMAGVDFTIH